MADGREDAPAATYRQLFAVREYRSLFGADLVSTLGDQVAAVALVVLVYERSDSPFLAALGYSLVFLPWLLGGPVLAAVAERLPSRRVLVGSDWARAALIGLAALPGMPLPVLGLLLLAAALLSPAFSAARAALTVEVLDDDRYSLSLSVGEVLHQAAQLVGFVGGGALVLLLSPSGALGLNAATFAVSGVLLLRGLQSRPAALARSERTSLLRESAAGLRIVARDRALRRPLLLAVIGGTYVVVPEAIAPALVAEQGGGTVAVGLVMASVAGGSVAGAVLIARFVRPAARERLMLPLALLGALPLALVALQPGLTASLVLLVLAGLCTAYNVPANAAFAAAVPEHARARAFGLAMTAIMGGQLLGVLAGGALAELFRPSQVIAGAAGLGVLALLALRLDTAAPARPDVVLPDQRAGAEAPAGAPPPGRPPVGTAAPGGPDRQLLG